MERYTKEDAFSLLKPFIKIVKVSRPQLAKLRSIWGIHNGPNETTVRRVLLHQQVNIEAIQLLHNANLTGRLKRTKPFELTYTNGCNVTFKHLQKLEKIKWLVLQTSLKANFRKIISKFNRISKVELIDLSIEASKINIPKDRYILSLKYGQNITLHVILQKKNTMLFYSLWSTYKQIKFRLPTEFNLQNGK